MRVSSLTTLCAAVTSALGNYMGGDPYTDFPLPPSKDIVSVRMLDSFQGVFPHSLIIASNPDAPILPQLSFAGWAFLLEDARTGWRESIDLGLRQDFDNLVSAAVSAYGGFSWNISEDVPRQLTKGNISLKSIDPVIWRCVPPHRLHLQNRLTLSHSHFDYVGDMTKLPNSTRLYIGSGILANALPAHPTHNMS
jgi:hypothetical protein